MRAGILASLMTGAVAALLVATAAHSGTPVRVEKTCPINGEKFTFTETGSYSTYGMYSDGMPRGSWEFPAPIPQCPGTRFPVVKREYSDAEKALYQAMVQTPEYQAIKDKASYYVLNFVMARNGQQTPESHVWLLIQASWQVRDDPETLARYAGELGAALQEAGDYIAANSAESREYYQLCVANILRQAGDFEASNAILDLVQESEDKPRVSEWKEKSRNLNAARDSSQYLVFGQDFS